MSVGPLVMPSKSWRDRSGWPVLADPLAAVPAELPDHSPLGPAASRWPRSSRRFDQFRCCASDRCRPVGDWRLGCAFRGHQQWLITEGDARNLDPLDSAIKTVKGWPLGRPTVLMPAWHRVALAPDNRRLCANCRPITAFGLAGAAAACLRVVTEPALMHGLPATCLLSYR